MLRLNHLPFMCELSKKKSYQKKQKNKRAMMALGRSPEYHWNQIISKSVHGFSRSRLKLFFIYSPGGNFVMPPPIRRIAEGH